MKATIERATLLKGLSHVQSVVERRNTIPILSNVLLEATAEGTLKLMATDLDLQINESVAAAVDQPGATTVSALAARKTAVNAISVRCTRAPVRVRVSTTDYSLHIALAASRPGREREANSEESMTPHPGASRGAAGERGRVQHPPPFEITSRRR
jgi:hypothetical protein